MRIANVIEQSDLQGRSEFRALFLSDVHLGSHACRSDALADFLRRHRADAIYLVGDIVDGWRLRANWYWPPSHAEILRQLVTAARRPRAYSGRCRIGRECARNSPAAIIR